MPLRCSSTIYDDGGDVGEFGLALERREDSPADSRRPLLARPPQPGDPARRGLDG
jgi:hypothetical protein